MRKWYSTFSNTGPQTYDMDEIVGAVAVVAAILKAHWANETASGTLTPPLPDRL